MESAPMPAVAVSVFDRGSVLFSAVRGVADLSTRRAARPDDWWDLASLTKVLVTLPEVLALCERGMLDLDTSLGEQWSRARARPVGAATVRQLLAHSAGLPGIVEYFRHASDRSAMVEAALVISLDYNLGSYSVICYVGYLLLV